MPLLDEIFSQLSVALQTLYDYCLPYVEQVSWIAQGVAGLLAFVYIGSRLWEQWARGKSIDFYPLLKPFALGILILFFSVFASFLQVLVRPIEAAAASLNAAVYEEYAAQQQAYQQAQLNLRNSLASFQRDELEWEDPSSEEAGEMAVYQKVAKVGAQCSQYLLVGIVTYYQIFTTAAKLILLLVGPFALAFSLFPGFQHNVQHWVSHYVQILLYLPLCSLVGFVVALLMTHCLYAPFAQWMGQQSWGTEGLQVYQELQQLQLTLNLSTTLFYVLSFVLYTRIPQFSRWIIRSCNPSSIT